MTGWWSTSHGVALSGLRERAVAAAEDRLRAERHAGRFQLAHRAGEDIHFLFGVGALKESGWRTVRAPHRVEAGGARIAAHAHPLTERGVQVDDFLARTVIFLEPVATPARVVLLEAGDVRGGGAATAAWLHRLRPRAAEALPSRPTLT